MRDDSWAEIQKVVDDFMASPKGVNNCATMAGWATQIVPELIEEIKQLKYELSVAALQIKALKEGLVGANDE